MQSADAVAADGTEQAVKVGAVGVGDRREAAADVVVVGQQVVEDGDNGRADIAVLAQRQGQRYGKGMLPA